MGYNYMEHHAVNLLSPSWSVLHFLIDTIHVGTFHTYFIDLCFDIYIYSGRKLVNTNTVKAKYLLNTNTVKAKYLLNTNHFEIPRHYNTN